MTDVLFEAVFVLNVVVLVYFLLLNTGYLATTILSVAALRRHAKRARAADIAHVLTSGAPPITLIAPAYNEEATCVEATTALLSLVYPEYEVLVVNDGSKDATIQRLIEAFDLEPSPRAPTAELSTARVRETYRSRRRPNLWVIDKENGGKADALNAGINYCATELFCAMDADTLLERDALARVVRPFLEDARTMAAGGIIRIVNDSRVRLGIVEQVRLPRSRIARFQVLEYLRAFLAGRVGWDVLDAMLIISGAFGLFRRSLAVELGGYATDTVGEDMELVVRMHRFCRERKIPYRVTFIPDPVAWTECPESLRVLGRQRDRWQRGLMQVLWRHRVMLLNPKYGRVGMLAFPYFFFLEGWGPLIELAGYLSFAVALLLGLWSPLYALAFFAIAFVFGAALSLAAIGLEELSFRRYERGRDLARLLLVAVLEPLGYRQLSTWWRVKGVISALRGVQGWGAMERRGFRTAAALLLLVTPVVVHAQDSSRASARVAYTREEFTQRGAVPWEEIELSLGRRLPQVAGSAGILSTKRFAQHGMSVFADLYPTLWRRAYANVRFRHATSPADIIPDDDISAELFQGIGRGWEPSVGYRWMDYSTGDVNALSAALGKYHADWYGRVRSTYALGYEGTAGSFAHSGLLRRYGRSGSEWLEASAGWGDEQLVSPAPGGRVELDTRATRFVSVGGRQFVSRSLGIALNVSHNRFEGVPDRVGGTLALLARW